MDSPAIEVPTESDLRESIARDSPEQLVRELFAHACARGAPGSGESLLVAGAVSDLLVGHDAETDDGAGGEWVHEVLSAAWAYLSLLPRRNLPTKWLRQLPREDRPFLFVRSLEEVVAAETMEGAAHRLSAILRALNESVQRDALLLEAAAWTPNAIALPAVQAAVAATREASVEESRPYWIRILECIYTAGAEIPFRPAAAVPFFGWEQIARDWPEDPRECIEAWIARPRWLRAIQQAGTKSSSVRHAIVRQLEPAQSRNASAQASAPLVPREVGGRSAHWLETREHGRTTRPLQALRWGRPEAFLALVGLCVTRDQPLGVDASLLERTYRAWDRIA